MLESTTELRAALAALALLLLPGRVLLHALGLARAYQGLSGWLIAAALGANRPPLLLALLDAMSAIAQPPPALAPWLIRGVLLLSALDLVRRALRRPAELTIPREEWTALAALLVVLAVRAALAVEFALPPLTDSLHHALLSQAVIETGILPATLPVFPEIALDRYHLGLYSIVAATAWVGDVPAHTALVWSGQLLNALAAAGAWLVLRRRVSLDAALLGLLAAGLIGHMPSASFGWGRFTQVAAQALLPAAWLLGWDWLRQRSGSAPRSDLREGGLLIAAMLVSLAVAWIHLRVAIFLGAALLVSFVAEAWAARRNGQAGPFWKAAFGGGAVALMLLLPRYGLGAWHWLWGHWFLTLDGSGWSGADDDRAINAAGYFAVWRQTPLEEWVAAPLLLAAAMLLGALALVRGERLSRVVWAWIAALLAIGSIHALGIHVLNIVPLNAVLIFLYLPLALLLGCGFASLEQLLPETRARGARNLLLAAAWTLAVLSVPARLREIPPAWQLADPGDHRAFAWIRENVEPAAGFAIAADNLFTEYIVGTDGGYWIPYFTGHRTVPGTMLAPLNPRALRRAARVFAIQREAGFADSKIDRLLRHGVRYFYFSRSAAEIVDAHKLARLPRLELVYDSAGVRIVKLIRTPAEYERQFRNADAWWTLQGRPDLADYPPSWGDGINERY